MTKTPTFREQLFSAAGQAAAAEPMVDPQTGADVLDAQAAAHIATVFELCGVTGLQSGDPDRDLILNTACTLSLEVAAHVEALDAVAGKAGALAEADDWHPDYCAYVEALWRGDREEIARLAAVLGLTNGIPNGSLALKEGPLG